MILILQNAKADCTYVRGFWVQEIFLYLNYYSSPMKDKIENN
jgi:hypothetical protein